MVRRPAPRAEIICVGSELLAGKPNTHVPVLGPLLRRSGFRVPRSQTVADSVPEIRDAISAAVSRSEAVLVCGGLGPTFDDLTREAAARALGLGMAYREDLYGEIRRKYFRRRMRIPSNNKRQAWVIDGAVVLPNKKGSAPGQLLTVPGRPYDRTVALLPGPLAELMPMLEGSVLPELGRRCGRSGVLLERVWRFSGLGESAADQRLKPLIRRPGLGVELTILASPGQVDLHAAVRRKGVREARALLESLDRRVVRLLGAHLFGRDRESLPSALGARLRALGWTIAVAESCTGGLVSQGLTSVPGSSDYFLGGVVAYRDDVKSARLGVRAATLRRWGAVSAQCAGEMAAGVREAMGGADAGLSITGIAGPGGGTASKPVGLVFIAVDCRGRAASRRLLFRGDRREVRERAANAAMMLALESLTGAGAVGAGARG